MKGTEQAWSRFVNVLKEFVEGINFETDEMGHNLLEEGYLDSIEFLNLLMALEDEFGVDLDLTNFEGANPDSIKSLFEMITKE